MSDDELLADRVKQLKEIEEWLEQIEKYAPRGLDGWTLASLRDLRSELKLMIQNAEREHAEF